MKSAKYISVLAVIITAMSFPLRAEIIADQSRISVMAPELPGHDLVNWSGIKKGTPKY